AREWDKKNRNASFLLRGADLDEAEHWLEQGADKEPRPSALHTHYIATSRKAAIARTRLTLTLAAVAVIISLGFALLAFYSYTLATQESQIAQQRLIVSENLRQAADSQSLPLNNEGNPELA